MARDYKYEITKLDHKQDKAFLDDLNENLRLQDLDEMLRLGISDSRQELMETVLASDECFKAVDAAGRAIAAYGIIPGNKVNPGGQVWCLGTYRLSMYALPFTRGCKKVFAGWLPRYSGQLWNFISAENVLSISWLKICGAKFERGIVVNGHRFYKFIIKEKG